MVKTLIRPVIQLIILYLCEFPVLNNCTMIMEDLTLEKGGEGLKGTLLTILTAYL